MVENYNRNKTKKWQNYYIAIDHWPRVTNFFGLILAAVTSSL